MARGDRRGPASRCGPADRARVVASVGDRLVGRVGRSQLQAVVVSTSDGSRARGADRGDAPCSSGVGTAHDLVLSTPAPASASQPPTTTTLPAAARRSTKCRRARTAASDLSSGIAVEANRTSHAFRHAQLSAVAQPGACDPRTTGPSPLRRTGRRWTPTTSPIPWSPRPHRRRRAVEGGRAQRHSRASAAERARLLRDRRSRPGRPRAGGTRRHPLVRRRDRGGRRLLAAAPASAPPT